MLHPTMLDDVGPTCWLRLNRPFKLGFLHVLPLNQPEENVSLVLVSPYGNTGRKRCSLLSLYGNQFRTDRATKQK